MSEEFELISVPKELLENLVRRILAEYISLSPPEPEQDEPVDISDKSEPTVAAILPNGVRVTNVHDAYIAGMFEGSGLAKLKAEQDEEPNGFEYEPITVSKDFVRRIRDFFSEKDDCPDADELLAETRWWLD